ncbi:MAG: cyclase family protein, partial [Clostridia bacterium]|nr:cyclase family protein [Clostridia bacterium]
MKIYDISQPVFSCEVYPGDDAPVKKEDLRMSNGATYNLTSFSMCAHNGTHVDAPFHFINDGKTVDELELDHLIGYCSVVRAEGKLSANDAERIIALTKEKNEDAAQKILLKGDSVVTAEAAEVFASQGVDLIGVESQSVGP